MDRESTGNNNLSKSLAPADIVGLNESLGYLDRMIAGGDHSQRQFLGRANKGSGHGQKKFKKEKNQQNSDKACLQNQSPVVNIDDASWIADRKRKFPKLGGDVSAQNNDSAPTETNDNPSDRESPRSKNTTRDKPNITAKCPEPPRRRKTLFEKLIEMDQQSTE
jgi:hypothetical protein